MYYICLLLTQMNHKMDENNKPVKQKRRSSLTKADRTPTGPTPKKQRTRTRTLKSKLDNSVTEEKENLTQNYVVSPAKETSPSKKPVSKPVLAVCKDVTSRGLILTMIICSKV